MKDIKIMIAHHKPGVVIESEMYLPIHVGKAISEFKLLMQGDDSGENISRLNPLYCEMTAVYWGWKNLDEDYIGLCHYRRYFTFMRKSLYNRMLGLFKYFTIRAFGNLLRPGLDYVYTEQICTDDKLFFKENASCFEKEIRQRLLSNEVDFVVPTPYRFSCRDNESFFTVIGRDHIQKLKEIVSEIKPEFFEYVEDTLKSNVLFAANMCILKKEFFHEYCNFIFPILQTHLETTKQEKWCKEPLDEKCYARISGYLAELLTNAYILKLKKENKKGLIANVMFLQ